MDNIRKFSVPNEYGKDFTEISVGGLSQEQADALNVLLDGLAKPGIINVDFWVVHSVFTLNRLVGVGTCTGDDLSRTLRSAVDGASETGGDNKTIVIYVFGEELTEDGLEKALDCVVGRFYNIVLGVGENHSEKGNYTVIAAALEK